MGRSAIAAFVAALAIGLLFPAFAREKSTSVICGGDSRHRLATGRGQDGCELLHATHGPGEWTDAGRGQLQRRRSAELLQGIDHVACFVQP